MIQKEYELINEQVNANTLYICYEVFEQGDYFKEYFNSNERFKNLPLNIQYDIITFICDKCQDKNSFLIFITKLYNDCAPPITILIAIINKLTTFEVKGLLIHYSKYLNFEDYQSLLYTKKYIYFNLYITDLELKKQINELYNFLSI